MQKASQFAVQLFRRTRDFLVRVKPPIALGELTPHIDTLGHVAEQLSAAAIEQDTRSRQSRAGTVQLNRQMRTLRLEYMRPLARASRALFSDDPALQTTLRLPARLRRPEEVVAAANAMSSAALPYQERFVAAGFRSDFAERLRGAAAGVREAVDRRATEISRRSAATATAHSELARGRAVLALVDAMVAPRLEGNADQSAEWRSLMRQGRTRPVEDTEFPVASASTTVGDSPTDSRG